MLMMAALALRPEEAMTEKSTAQILLKLFGYEIRKWISGIPNHLLLEPEPIGLDEFVEDRLLGLVPGVGELFGCGI